MDADLEERYVCLDRVKKAIEIPVENKHYTFDFSQYFSLPHYSRQMDPFYVLTLRKVQIFGFRISGGNQLYFLMDESETLGQDGKNTHGPIAVLSMIDWALESRCQPSQSFTIHADNCPGKTKTCTSFDTSCGGRDTIEYRMQIQSDARCRVDSGFVWSSATNVSERCPAWCWRDWKAFLGSHFKQLPGIRKCQYFRMSAGNPGAVVVKERMDGEEKSKPMLKNQDFRFPSADRPASIPAAGYSDTRRD